jgi:hypothetical protein
MVPQYTSEGRLLSALFIALALRGTEQMDNLIQHAVAASGNQAISLLPVIRARARIACLDTTGQPAFRTKKLAVREWL